MSEGADRARTESVLIEVYAERATQRGRWTNQFDDSHSHDHWAMILGTYFGSLLAKVFFYTQGAPTEEAALRHIEYDVNHIRAGLIKVAAIAVAWVEAIDRRRHNRA